MLRIENILVARDFSPSSDRALSYAVDLARQTGSVLHLVHAHVFLDNPLGASPDQSGEREDGIRERLLQDVDGTPLSEKYPGIELHGHAERNTAAAPVILNYAVEQDIDLIVMGTRGRRGVQRALLGSVAEEVVRHASQPVLTVHSNEEEDGQAVARLSRIERILVPVDFSDHAREALRHAHAVAALYDAELDLLHVTDPHLHPAFYGGGLDETYDLEKEQKAEEKLHAFFEAVTPPVNSEGKPLRRSTMEAHVAAGRPAEEIIQHAEESGSDLVVMSTHGVTGLQRFMMGSVAEKVVRHVRIPVFTVKAFGKSLVEPPEGATHEADR